MNAALISDKREQEQHKHYDQNNPLFVHREFEDSKQTFHLSRMQSDLVTPLLGSL